MSSASIDAIRGLIDRNFNGGSQTLLGALKAGRLDRPLLDEFVRTIADPGLSEIGITERDHLAARLWQIAFHIQEEITFHFDPNDVARIDNASIAEIRGLSKQVFWLCNRFAHAKPIEDKDLLLENWS